MLRIVMALAFACALLFPASAGAQRLPPMKGTWRTVIQTGDRLIERFVTFEENGSACVAQRSDAAAIDTEPYRYTFTVADSSESTSGVIVSTSSASVREEMHYAINYGDMTLHINGARGERVYSKLRTMYACVNLVFYLPTYSALPPDAYQRTFGFLAASPSLIGTWRINDVLHNGEGGVETFITFQNDGSFCMGSRHADAPLESFSGRYTATNEAQTSGISLGALRLEGQASGNPLTLAGGYDIRGFGGDHLELDNIPARSQYLHFTLMSRLYPCAAGAPGGLPPFSDLGWAEYERVTGRLAGRGL